MLYLYWIRHIKSGHYVWSWSSSSTKQSDSVQSDLFSSCHGCKNAKQLNTRSCLWEGAKVVFSKMLWEWMKRKLSELQSLYWLWRARVLLFAEWYESHYDIVTMIHWPERQNWLAAREGADGTIVADSCVWNVGVKKRQMKVQLHHPYICSGRVGVLQIRYAKSWETMFQGQSIRAGSKVACIALARVCLDKLVS